MKRINSLLLTLSLVMLSTGFVYADAALPPEPGKSIGAIVGGIVAGVAAIIAAVKRKSIAEFFKKNDKKKNKTSGKF